MALIIISFSGHDLHYPYVLLQSKSLNCILDLLHLSLYTPPQNNLPIDLPYPSIINTIPFMPKTIKKTISRKGKGKRDESGS